LNVLTLTEFGLALHGTRRTQNTFSPEMSRLLDNIIGDQRGILSFETHSASIRRIAGRTRLSMSIMPGISVRFTTWSSISTYISWNSLYLLQVEAAVRTAWQIASCILVKLPLILLLNSTLRFKLGSNYTDIKRHALLISTKRGFRYRQSISL
jgi:hypothetical protein